MLTEARDEEGLRAGKPSLISLFLRVMEFLNEFKGSFGLCFQVE
jgi:hypothetical protein